MSSIPYGITGEKVYAQVKSRVATEIGASVALMVLLTVALSYWLWFSLSLRVVNFDDGISILAAQSVLEHGYQLLPSGYFYDRGYLPHFLVAGSIGLFGLNHFSIALPSLIMGLGSLFLAYRTAKDILGQPWLGIVVVAVLLALSSQTWYATGPRMYMGLQFFTLLAVYSAWRGFIQHEAVFKLVAVLAIIGALLSHREGAIIAIAIPVTILVIMKLRGETWRTIFSRQNIISMAVVGLSTLALIAWTPSNVIPPIVGHAGIIPDRIGLNLNPISWGRHILHLERSIPYSLGFLGLAYFVAFRLVRDKLDPQYKSVYLLLAFTLFFLLYGSVVKSGGARLIFFLLPLYALVVCTGVAGLVQILGARSNPGLDLSRAGQIAGIAILVVGVAASVLFATLKQVSFDAVRDGDESAQQFVVNTLKLGPSFVGLAREGYGLACLGLTCSTDLRDTYKIVKGEVAPDDLVVSMRPFEANFFLQRLDGWFFTRNKSRDYSLTLDKSPTDEYFGVPIVDTPEELSQLGISSRRAWVIVTNVSPEMQRLLDEEFHEFLVRDYLTVYVSSAR